MARALGVNIPGAQERSYTIVDVSPADAGTYDVVVKTRCTTLSDPAELTVIHGPKAKHTDEEPKPRSR